MLDKDNIRRLITENFSYLFNEYNFKEIYYNDRYGRYAEGLLLGVQSGKCRFLFVKEPELKHTSIWVGLISAPFENPDATGPDGWFNVLAVGYFLSGNVISTSEDYGTLDEVARLRLIGSRLSPNIKKIIDHFQDKKTMETWLSKYYDFIKQNYKSRR